MIRRHPFWFSFLLLLLILIAAGVVRARMPKPVMVRAEAASIDENITSLVIAPGEIRAHEMVDIQAEIAGVIIDLPVREGMQVQRGELLLGIDPVQARAEVASAEARLAAAQSEVLRIEAGIQSANANVLRAREAIRSAEVDREEAEITHERNLANLERMKNLLEGNTISVEEYEVIETRANLSAQRIRAAAARIEQSKADLLSAQASLAQQQAARKIIEQDIAAARAALDRVQDMYSKVTIVSPLDGVIAQLNVNIGERAVPGIQSNPQATLMTIANMNMIEAEIAVDESDIVRVALGQNARVMVDALPNTPLEGTVVEIGNMPIRAQSSQEGKDFKVVIQIAEPPDSLRVGMSCEAEITIDSRDNVLTIPIQALALREVPVDSEGNYLPPPKPQKRRRGDRTETAEDRNQRVDKAEVEGVFVFDPEGFSRYRPVKTGLMGEMKVEIIKGLSEGDEVITGPLSSLRLLDEWTFVRKQPGL